MSGLTELLERVAEATGPDRGIDKAIALFEGWTRHSDIESPVYTNEINMWWAEPGSNWSTVAAPPRYTEKIDDALALVEQKLPGCTWGMSRITYVDKGGRVEVVRFAIGAYEDTAPTAPLAILLALLRALIAQQSGDGK